MGKRKGLQKEKVLKAKEKEASTRETSKETLKARAKEKEKENAQEKN